MADSDDDLPESISFSSSKLQAIQEFQSSVKHVISTKKRNNRNRNNREEKQIDQKIEKGRPRRKLSEENDSNSKKNKIRVIEKGNTVFQIETLDDNLSKGFKIGEKAEEFRRKKLSDSRIKRETARSWLDKRIKRQVANRKAI